MAIRHLGPRLHELLAKDMHDGWGSASAKIVMRDLTSFTDWTDGGELHLKKLMQEAKEEEDKKWITPMRV